MPGLPNPFGGVIEAVLGQLFNALTDGLTVLLGLILSWSGRVTEVDFAAPWMRDASSRLLGVTLLFAIPVLVLATVLGARRGIWGAFTPLGRLIGAVLWFGLLRVALDVVWTAADGATTMIVGGPDGLAGDLRRIMDSISTMAAGNGAAGIIVWIFLAVMSLVAALLLSIQFAVQHVLIVLLYVAAPIVVVASMLDRGLDWLRRWTFVAGAVVFAKPLIAAVLAVTAGALQPVGGTGPGLDHAIAMGGLIIASFVPYLLVAAAFRAGGSMVARSSAVASPVHVSTAAGHVSTQAGYTAAQRQQVHEARASVTSVRSMKARYEKRSAPRDHPQRPVRPSSTHPQGRPAATGAASAVGAVATVGVAAAGTAAKKATTTTAKAVTEPVAAVRQPPRRSDQ
jgi:hypothetical protein